MSTYIRAHDGHEVCSVKFSRNGKYILSSGKDSLIKLWEFSTNRCLIAYTGAGATGKQVCNWKFKQLAMTAIRVTSLEHLSVAEFSGE